MRRKTLRDFSISSERKVEHRGGWAGGNGPNLIFFRSFHKFFFFPQQNGSFNISTPRMRHYVSGLQQRFYIASLVRVISLSQSSEYV